MAGIHAQNGRLLVSFQYAMGGARHRCREYLGMADTRDNRRLAARIALEIEQQLAAGSLDYARRFPASPMLDRLGLKACPAAPPLAAYAARWLAAHRAHLAPGTAYDYSLLIGKHLAATALGRRPLDLLGRHDVDHWILELKAHGVGPRRINMALARLRSILRMAEEEGLLTHNPLQLVRNLREPRPRIDPFTTSEIEALLRAAKPGLERAFVAILVLAGLRPSEALGLQWADLDLTRAVAGIRRSRGRFGPGLTKTLASEREVDLSDGLVALLRALPQGPPEAWVFTGRRGKALEWNNFRRRDWPRLLRAAGLRMRPPYQCRHSFAARLLAAGEAPQYVAHQMGHASLAMVIRHYARWSRKPARRIPDTLVI